MHALICILYRHAIRYPRAKNEGSLCGYRPCCFCCALHRQRHCTQWNLNWRVSTRSHPCTAYGAFGPATTCAGRTPNTTTASGAISWYPGTGGGKVTTTWLDSPGTARGSSLPTRTMKAGRACTAWASAWARSTAPTNFTSTGNLWGAPVASRPIRCPCLTAYVSSRYRPAPLTRMGRY